MADSQVYRIIIDRPGVSSTFGASDIAPLTAEPQHSHLALTYARPTRTKASGPMLCESACHKNKIPNSKIRLAFSNKYVEGAK